MRSIVLKIPYESTAFRDAREVLRNPLPTATYHARQEILARVQEWTGITILLDDVAYVPLRTDWLPPRDRRTADGIEVLVDGGRPDQWPPEVQAAIEAGRFARISSRVVDELWKVLHDGQNMEKAGDINVPSPDGGAAAAVAVAAEEADAGGAEDVPAECPEAAPAEADEERSDLNDIQS